MLLNMNGKTLEAHKDESLLDLIKRSGEDSADLKERPLAAKIAGGVFTLNYIPVRQKEADPDRPAVRRAMQASNGEVKLLRYADSAGKDVYVRTACFLVFLSLQKLWPDCIAKNSCTIGNSVYISVENCLGFDIAALKNQIKAFVEQDFPLIRRRVARDEAIARFANSNQADKAELLRWRELETYDEYFFNEYADYFYGEMLPSTGYVTVWEILPSKDGFILLYPDDLNPNQTADFNNMPNFFNVFTEGEKWGQLMECETVSNLNGLTTSGRIRELVRINEAFHEKRFSQIADMICERGAQIVMLSGPSSSGKTTSANRLAIQLRVHGKKPMIISLDNYYFDRDSILSDADGNIDLEHINAIDTALFRQNIKSLLSGEEIILPSFNFVSGKREWNDEYLKLQSDSIIIVEGIHGLNPILLPDNISSNQVFKLYVSPLLPLNMDNHNRIPTSYLRLLRRTVRDYETRGSSVQKTLSMWKSVQDGEKRWIFPFQENADTILNSSTLYELAVLKKHIFPLLTAVQPEEECYGEVRSIVKILNYIVEADIDDEIPPTSIVREFIGGNTFYR